jgi:hypothetical protein
MDEEELVMQFTEERSLITLGWVRCRSYQWASTRCSLARDLSDTHTSDAVL